MQAALAFVVAMGVAVALLPLLIRRGPAWGLVDRPDPRKVHTSVIPRVGGIAMFVGIALSLLLYGKFDRSMQALLAGNFLLFVFGVWDDRVTLSSRPKFLGQALAAAVAVFWGGFEISHLSLQDMLSLPMWVGTVLSLLFLVGATNAVNLSDGLDGLAGGMSLLCLTGLTVIAFAVGNSMVLIAAAGTAGAVLGFLRFNTHPARVFMGDAGSQVLGFTAAVLAIELTQHSNAPLSGALPLLLLGVPLTDTLLVMAVRLASGRSPFVADRNHLHHRLLVLGFVHVEAVVILYMIQVVMFLLAWFLRYAADTTVLGAYLIVAVSFAAAIALAQRSGWRYRAAQQLPVADQQRSPMQGAIAALFTHQTLSRMSLRVMIVTLLGYALYVVAADRTVESDIALTGAVAAVVLLAGLVLPGRKRNMSDWEKIALYVIAAMAVTLDYLQGATSWRNGFEMGLFAVLALAVLVWVGFSYGKRFEVTPLDVLVLAAALVVPNLPGVIEGSAGIGLLIVKMVVIFYGLEALSSAGGARYRWISGGALAFVSVVLLRMV